MFCRFVLMSTVLAVSSYAASAKAARVDDIRQSAWKSYYEHSGTNVPAELLFDGDTGTYDDRYGGGQLRDVRYGLNHTSRKVLIEGRWLDAAGHPGRFRLLVASDGGSFTGEWESARDATKRGMWQSLARVPKPTPLPLPPPVARQWNKLFPLTGLKYLPAAYRYQRAGYIDDPRTWAAVWKTWQPYTVTPYVDFRRQFVVFVKNVRFLNRISLSPPKLRGGTLFVNYGTTRTARPIRDQVYCVMFVAQRQGVKAIDVDGKRIPLRRPAPKPARKVIVNRIVRVNAYLRTIFPVDLVVQVTGRVPTAGYRNVQLVRVVYDTPPADGIQDYVLYAVPPNGPAAQVISTVTASSVWKAYQREAPWVEGVRIHGIGDGVVVKMLSR